MRSSTWQLVLATGLGMAVATVISYGTHSNAQAPAGRAPAAGNRAAQVTKAICVIQPLGGSEVGGKVVFTQQRGGVEVNAELTGLKPGEHGFHVHEFGDCSMADGTCAGAHFNPTGAPHGGPDDEKRHAGDLGNITADESGKATYKRVDKMLSLNGPNSIIGRSIIVHAAPDDLKTQPSGNAGARVGCGVIGIADPKMQH
jgi:Cu-Zn family superoxide dismutase